jgi:hypothetical protein
MDYIQAPTQSATTNRSGNNSAVEPRLAVSKRAPSRRRPAEFERAAILASLIALGLSPQAALAGRPLATEDAGVITQAECELESYAGRVTAPTAPTVSTRWAQIGCGIGSGTQFTFGIGPDRDETGSTVRESLGGKTFLRELTDEQMGFALAYVLFGAREPGNSFRHEATELSAVVTIPVDGWLLHANAGWHHVRREKQQNTIWALAVERPEAIGPVDLMAEVFGDDRCAPWMQMAARWTVVPKQFFLDTSWGRQLNSTHSRQVTVGLKLAF